MWVFAFCLIVLVLAALVFRDPGFIDSYYYFHVASNLAAGRGFTEDLIWSYIVQPEALTHASNLYWMPLVSVVIAPFLALFGDTFRAAQLPLVIVSATVPAFTAVLGKHALGGWFKGLAAAWLVLFCGYYFVYWVAVDGFALYTLAAGASFLATAKITGKSGPALLYGAALGGACAAGHFARADGPLLLLTNLGVVLFTRREVRPAAVAVATYVLFMSPWFLRNYLVAGAPLAGGGLQTVFLREYNEIFAYGLPLDLHWYLGQDMSQLLEGKASAALRNLGVLFGLQYWLVPVAVIGWRAALTGGGRRRVSGGAPDSEPGTRNPELFLPPLVYGVALYLVMTLVFTFPSGRGTMLHSSVALLPWLAVAAVAGVERTVNWVARRRRHWQPARAFRNFTFMFLGFSLAVSLYALVDQARGWSRQVDAYRSLAPLILADHPHAVPMVLNAPGWWYVTRRPALQTPSNGPDAALAVAARYGATHFIAEPAGLPAWEGFVVDPRFQPAGAVGAYRVYRLVR